MQVTLVTIVLCLHELRLQIIIKVDKLTHLTIKPNYLKCLPLYFRCFFKKITKV